MANLLGLLGLKPLSSMATWATLRADVSGGQFVDYRRLLFDQAA